MELDTNQQTFFELMRAGLWEKEVRLLQCGKVDYDEVFRIADEQSVIGLVTAGIEHVQDVKIPQDVVLQFIGTSLQLEQQNKDMNVFIGKLIERMRNVGIYSLLLKGQGIAQCYERPLWRASGDVDLFLSEDNYKKAVDYLVPLATDIEKEYKYNMHQAMTIDSWTVELHGSLRGGLSSKIDTALDDIKKNVFCGGNVRSWMNGKTQVFLLGVDNDIVYVFSHLLTHFYKEGLGLRQICDWCRLLWTYRCKIDVDLLEKRLREVGLMSEWKAFGAFAVYYLGMPYDAMPLYSADAKWKRKADKICSFILEVGNMGHNRDMSYFEKYPYLIRKVWSLVRRCGDLIRHARIFPLDSLRFFPRIMFNGLRSAVRGE
nr:nucleotidyltransferase family protein [uncultured Prevotella sp.]